MKKFLCTILVAMLTMVSMTSMAIDPPVIAQWKDYFTITNKTTNAAPKKILIDEFTSGLDGTPSCTVNLEGGIYKGEEIEITYHNRTLMGTPYLRWYSGWNASNDGSVVPLTYRGTGLTKEFTIENIPIHATYFLVKCNYQTDEQSSKTNTYLMFIKVINGNRITAKSNNASEVQVSYTNQEDAAAYAGKRVTTALYDIYGNKVSGGYLDAFGTSTLSTKGKPGYYIVKVMVDNRVIFTETIQVK